MADVVMIAINPETLADIIREQSDDHLDLKVKDD